MNLNTATEIAIAAAKESPMIRHRVGAILFDRSNHITGYSHLHGVEVLSRKNKWSIHAEEMAIIRGNRIGIDFFNATLVVVRINKNNELRISRPCKNCQKLINRFQIPRVYFSNDPFNREFCAENFKSLQQ
jgi:deoxycytidylate deaminase